MDLIWSAKQRETAHTQSMNLQEKLTNESVLIVLDGSTFLSKFSTVAMINSS